MLGGVLGLGGNQRLIDAVRTDDQVGGEQRRMWKEAAAEARRKKIQEAREFEENLKQFFIICGVILIVVALFVVMIAVIARAETKFVECRLEKYKKVNGEWHCVYLGANKTRTSMIVSEFCPRSYMCEYDPNSSDKLVEW